MPEATDSGHHSVAKFDRSSHRKKSKSNYASEFMSNVGGAWNKLQDVLNLSGLANELNLPQIVVVGTQSSGKSSTLESLIGFPLFPRGVGIVTRSPMIIHMINEDCDMKVQFKEADGQLSKPILNISVVDEELRKRTIAITGEKFITSEPIIMYVFSRDVVNLTVVDLPGLTKELVEGMPTNIDIQQLTKQMVLEYTKENKNSIILAIFAANADITTVDTHDVIREADPTSERTLGVLTKLDLMEEGEGPKKEIAAILENRKLMRRLRYGYIGVMNRSQIEIENNAPVSDVVAREQRFLRQTFPQIAHLHGIGRLKAVLSELMVKAIKQYLPSLRKECRGKITAVEAYLDNLGPPPDVEGEVLNQVTSKLCHEFANFFSKIVDGELFNEDTETRFVCGAIIKQVFYGTFCKEIRDLLQADDKETEAIKMSIINAMGCKADLFVKNGVIDHFIAKRMSRLEPSCVKFVESVAEIVCDTSLYCVEHLRSQHPNYMENVYKEIVQIVEAKMQEKKKDCVIKVKEMLAICFVRFYNPFQSVDALTDGAAAVTVPGQEAPTTIEKVSISNDLELFERQGILGMVNNGSNTVEKAMERYIALTAKSIIRNISSTVIYHLVDNVRDNMYDWLVFPLLSMDLSNMFVESTQVKIDRDTNETYLERLYEAERRAIDVISDAGIPIQLEAPLSSQRTQKQQENSQEPQINPELVQNGSA